MAFTDLSPMGVNMVPKAVSGSLEEIGMNLGKELNKSILIYTTLFDSKYWPTLNLEEIETIMNQCEYKYCDITYDKRDILSADAVLFHGWDLMTTKDYTSDILQDLAKVKPLYQKWVFLMHESPVKLSGFHIYKKLFDWVMSYKYTSDIFFPYGHYKPLDIMDSPPPDNINYAENKSNLGIWTVSNCGLPRGRYMKELKKYLPITVAGKCAKKLFNEEIKCVRGSKECHAILKSHKFYFAFENSFCDYYVTEKYWESGIDLGLVPVVMGARYNKENIIPGSFIDALQYPSIEELADYLKYLNSNDEEYNKYFEWKKKYKRIAPEKMCLLCEKLYTEDHSEPYEDPWSLELDCKPFQWKVDLVNKLINKSQLKTRT